MPSPLITRSCARMIGDFVSPMLPKQITAAKGPAHNSQRELKRSPHIPKKNWLMEVVICQRKNSAAPCHGVIRKCPSISGQSGFSDPATKSTRQCIAAAKNRSNQSGEADFIPGQHISRSPTWPRDESRARKKTRPEVFAKNDRPTACRLANTPAPPMHKHGGHILSRGQCYGLGAAGGLLPLLLTLVSVVVVVVPPGVVTLLVSLTLAVSPHPLIATAKATATHREIIRFMMESPKNQAT